ncbi:MAG TPA: hypothetical protein VJL87_00620, partial [Bdellovibrionota bacterium]|nr:hypothetical protein [Bdellovibrionota bacterium]
MIMRSMLIKPLMMILIIQLVVPAHLWAEDPESTTWPKKVHLQEFRKWAWKEKIPLLPRATEAPEMEGCPFELPSENQIPGIGKLEEIWNQRPSLEPLKLSQYQIRRLDDLFLLINRNFPEFVGEEIRMIDMGEKDLSVIRMIIDSAKDLRDLILESEGGERLRDAQGVFSLSPSLTDQLRGVRNWMVAMGLREQPEKAREIWRKTAASVQVMIGNFYVLANSEFVFYQELFGEGGVLETLKKTKGSSERLHPVEEEILKILEWANHEGEAFRVQRDGSFRDIRGGSVHKATNLNRKWFHEAVLGNLAKISLSKKTNKGTPTYAEALIHLSMAHRKFLRENPDLFRELLKTTDLLVNPITGEPSPTKEMSLEIRRTLLSHPVEGAIFYTGFVKGWIGETLHFYVARSLADKITLGINAIRKGEFSLSGALEGVSGVVTDFTHSLVSVTSWVSFLSFIVTMRTMDSFYKNLVGPNLAAAKRAILPSYLTHLDSTISSNIREANRTIKKLEGILKNTNVAKNAAALKDVQQQIRQAKARFYTWGAVAQFSGKVATIVPHFLKLGPTILINDLIWGTALHPASGDVLWLLRRGYMSEGGELLTNIFGTQMTPGMIGRVTTVTTVFVGTDVVFGSALGMAKVAGCAWAGGPLVGLAAAVAAFVVANLAEEAFRPTFEKWDRAHVVSKAKQKLEDALHELVSNDFYQALKGLPQEIHLKNEQVFSYEPITDDAFQLIEPLLNGESIAEFLSENRVLFRENAPVKDLIEKLGTIQRLSEVYERAMLLKEDEEEGEFREAMLHERPLMDQYPGFSKIAKTISKIRILQEDIEDGYSFKRLPLIKFHEQKEAFERAHTTWKDAAQSTAERVSRVNGLGHDKRYLLKALEELVNYHETLSSLEKQGEKEKADALKRSWLTKVLGVEN